MCYCKIHNITENNSNCVLEINVLTNTLSRTDMFGSCYKATDKFIFRLCKMTFKKVLELL